MERLNLEDVLEQVQDALEQNDLDGAAAILETYRPADQAEVFSDLEEGQQVALLPTISAEDSADILEELDDEQVAELIAELSTDEVIRIVDEMEPDEAADLLGDITPEQAEIVLSGLDDPEEVRPLLLHGDESAGGLMTSEYMALRRRMTAAEAMAAIRQWHPSEETIYYLFVVDRVGTLCGVVNLRQLIVADPGSLMMDFMDSEVISVRAGVDQEDVARIMARYDLIALPVVDSDNRLLGVVTFDDVIDVLEEEATEDIQRLGGAEPLERSYLDTPPLTITRKRIGWLLLLFVGGTLTGSVMRIFEDSLAAVVALSIFIPLLIGTGGNAGSQTTTTIIRSLALGEIEPREAFTILWHEVRVGIILGISLAVVAFLRAITWEPDPRLALTVAISILLVVLWSTAVGSLLPLAASRLKIDPALVSTPLLSTIVDATGLFIYFTTAGIILGI